VSVSLIKRRQRVSQLLFEIGNINCNVEKPFIFTSGWASPVYVDCRKIISMPRQRREIILIAAEEIERNIGLDQFDIIAGGETAGIPFAAWLAEYFYLPMVYVRKQQKEFGRMSQIEGSLEPGQRVLLVEDLATDAKSKVHFCEALRRAGAIVEHAIVVFYYGVYAAAPNNIRQAGITLHALTDWETTLEVGKASGHFEEHQAEEIKEFLRAPDIWSKAHGGA
jgi:orotate phosphoribosyltransferase